MRNIPCDGFIGTHYLDEEEQKEAQAVLAAQSLFRYDGPQLLQKTNTFEAEVKSYLLANHALACSSGTAALKLCCIALNIGPGDEVLMSPLTYIASASSVLSVGAIPVFVEIDRSMNIDPEDVEKKITDKTKAIMAVHYQGVPCDMDALSIIANKYGLSVIEDCAQAFGAKYNNQAVGTIGDVAAFSLQANKVITCGEGGIYVAKYEGHFKKGKRYHDNGGSRSGNDYPVWDTPETSYGENFKITELHSAIASAQLKKADRIIAHQQLLYEKMISGLSIDQSILRPIPANADPIPVSIGFTFESKATCQQAIQQLNQNGIGVQSNLDKLLTSFNTFRNKVGWHSTNFPYHLSDYQMHPCPRSVQIVERTAWLPLSPLLSDNDIAFVQEKVNEVVLDWVG